MHVKPIFSYFPTGRKKSHTEMTHCRCRFLPVGNPPAESPISERFVGAVREPPLSSLRQREHHGDEGKSKPTSSATFICSGQHHSTSNFHFHNADSGSGAASEGRVIRP